MDPARKRGSLSSRGLNRLQSYIRPVDLQLRVVVYCKRVHHQSPKNYQLDLFSPDGPHRSSPGGEPAAQEPPEASDIASDRRPARLGGDQGFDPSPPTVASNTPRWRPISASPRRCCGISPPVAGRRKRPSPSGIPASARAPQAGANLVDQFAHEAMRGRPLDGIVSL
jgi:hypothetical protein